MPTCVSNSGRWVAVPAKLNRRLLLRSAPALDILLNHVRTYACRKRAATKVLLSHSPIVQYSPRPVVPWSTVPLAHRLLPLALGLCAHARADSVRAGWHQSKSVAQRACPGSVDAGDASPHHPVQVSGGHCELSAVSRKGAIHNQLLSVPFPAAPCDKAVDAAIECPAR